MNVMRSRRIKILWWYALRIWDWLKYNVWWSKKSKVDFKRLKRFDQNWLDFESISSENIFSTKFVKKLSIKQTKCWWRKLRVTRSQRVCTTSFVDEKLIFITVISIVLFLRSRVVFEDIFIVISFLWYSRSSRDFCQRACLTRRITIAETWIFDLKSK